MFYFDTDAVGSVRQIASGTHVSRKDFQPFGTETGNLPSDHADAVGFAGKEIDDSKLNYSGARYYSSFAGRFTSPDDARYIDLSNPQSMNLYAYAFNNPLRWVDPTGHDTCADGYKTDLCTDAVVLPMYDVGDLRSFLHTSDTMQAGTQSTGKSAASNSNCSTNDAQVVRNASVAALSNLDPSRNQANNITPFNPNFASVGNPSVINTRGWTSQVSAHGSATESPYMPHQGTFAVKMYNDPSLGNVIAVVYPTMSIMHVIQAVEYELGVHVNAANARSYLGCR